MIINRTGGNTQFVRTNPTKQVKGGSFGEALNNASSAKDSFSSSSVSETGFSQSSFSTLPGTMAKIDKISAEIRDTDYSGMTKAEIYADIERKYTDAFDDYFASRAVCPCKDYEEINNSFLENVCDSIGTELFPVTLVNEARGYSGMSYDEIEAAIKEKYIGKTGFIDQLNLLGELYTSGVLSNKFGHHETNDMLAHLDCSLECYDYRAPSKNEWLEKMAQKGASSPFSLLLNNPYFAHLKEIYETMVDDILFGIGA